MGADGVAASGFFRGRPRLFLGPKTGCFLLGAFGTGRPSGPYFGLLRLPFGRPRPLFCGGGSTGPAELAPFFESCAVSPRGRAQSSAQFILSFRGVDDVPMMSDCKYTRGFMVVNVKVKWMDDEK